MKEPYPMTSGDMTTEKPVEIAAELEPRPQFETLLAELSAKLINLPAAEIDRQIEGAQRLVCESLGLDVAALWQWRPEDPWMLTLTHLLSFCFSTRFDRYGRLSSPDWRYEARRCIAGAGPALPAHVRGAKAGAGAGVA